MEPTLNDNDHLIVEKISYYQKEPQRFDIVAFSDEREITYIKRIIGLPGETIQIINGYVYINNWRLDDTFGSHIIEDAGLALNKLLLGENEYFVLGDNRNGSVDSRHIEIGTITREQIKGKVFMCLYPFSKFGKIE